MRAGSRRTCTSFVWGGVLATWPAAMVDRHHRAGGRMRRRACSLLGPDNSSAPSSATRRAAEAYLMTRQPPRRSNPQRHGSSCALPSKPWNVTYAAGQPHDARHRLSHATTPRYCSSFTRSPAPARLGAVLLVSWFVAPPLPPHAPNVGRAASTFARDECRRYSPASTARPSARAKF
jgi:hypothetical protein